MQATQLEGILQIADERQDGQLRDPLAPLRPLRGGGIVVPRNMIRDFRLKPGLLLKGDQRGRALGRLEAVEGRPPEEYGDRVGLYDATPLDPQPGIKLEHNPEE